MQLLRLFRTTTFRLALIYLLLFLAAVLPLLGFIYWSSLMLLERQTDETLASEVAGLEELYRTSQLAGLIEAVTTRANRADGGLYLLARPDGTPLAGNLKRWPGPRDEPQGRISFDYRPKDGGEIRPARGEYFLLTGGVWLLVGQDVSQLRRIEGLILQALGVALAATLCLGIVGGIVTSRRMIQRLEAINHTTRDIMAGDLGRRVALKGSGDELDQLAENLNAMLDQIERLMVAMKEVSANIAHDLRTPLNRLRSRIEVALISLDEGGESASVLERTLEETDQILTTFNALLSIARLEAGTVASRRETLSLAETAAAVVELYEPLAEERDVRLVCEVSGPGHMTGDKDLLSQAIANLLDNAIKFSPQGGTVRVSVAPSREPQTVEIGVSDDGPGIPEADRDRVRGRFVRLEASRNQPGSGLGLSLVAAVAQIHEGRFVLEAAHRTQPPGLLARLVFPSLP
ncbi:MAG: HAMP domain-containing protein [Alphaproteobacteria bacterium]|nr:HAMP domain-containing protein [Alphaproteobacteria bacterium]